MESILEMKKAEKRLLKTVKSKKKHGADPNLLTITTNFLAFFQFFLQIVVLGMKIHFTTSLIFLLQIREAFYLKKNHTSTEYGTYYRNYRYGGKVTSV